MTTIQNSAAAADHSPTLPPLVEAMLRPEFYPEPPDQVELIQTHISYVFIAGDFVYKLKKAVHFSFIDCTALAQRRHLCGEEIRLNRRLAPDMYLGVFPILRVGEEFILGDRPGEHQLAVDYVLKMRRLSDDHTLDNMLARGEVDGATMRALATVVVAFYQTASRADASKYGVTAELWNRIIGELIGAEQLIGETLSARDLSTLEDYCRGFIASHWKMFNARVDAGRVREGHGDLRCEHICIEDAKISIFDCVEFSPRLRTGDIALEIAFLAMDLDRLGAPGLADQLVAAVAESTRDEDLPLLIPFYKCYRAVVRGVVATLRSRQPEIEQRERQSAIAMARQYFTLARGYAIDSAPMIVVVCGLSGSGKSTVARGLQNRFGFPIISSDRTRKKLALIPIERRPADAYKAGIYSDTITESTYAEMLGDAERLVSDGSAVILDGTFQDPAQRKAAVELASRVKAKILFLECRADDSEVQRRLIEREKTGNNPSDATVAVYLRQREDFVALSEIPSSRHLVVDTGRPIDETVSAVKNAIEELSP